MVEGFVFLAEGSDESEINLGDAHFGDFLRTMKVDFLNEACKLVDIVFHADGSIFAERVERGFSDGSSISEVWPYSSSKRDQIFAASVILNTFVFSTLLRHFNNAS